MELLPKLTLKDHIHYIIALIGVVISGLAAFYAMQQTRTTVRAACTLARCSQAEVRLAEIVTLVVLYIAFAIYILAIQPLYTEGVNKGRVARAQGRGMPAEIASNGLYRWLWKHDLYYTAVSFLKTIWIPIAIFVVAYLLNELFIRLVLG
ncbi:MAG TPA: hypothetical protein PKZ84_14145 [Anaerolineae bacterium]|nr:hypothetical protein [Anaerolineae bacterium]HQI85805.1 hypothetical protein [Anaerolineae bacterium]